MHGGRVLQRRHGQRRQHPPANIGPVVQRRHLGGDDEPSPEVADLEGVSCSSTRSCRAVGYYRGRAALDFALVESYVGSSWSITPVPSPPVGFLYAVSCASSSSCKAVGQHSDTSADTLVESWNGHAWTASRLPALN